MLKSNFHGPKLAMLLVSTSIVSALLWVSPARAQPAAKVAAAENDTGLAEIVVTANRRSESAQRVPISISAISGDVLRSTGTVEVVGLAQVSPGVFIAPTTSTTTTIIRIRGVGTSGTNNGFESAVGVFVDGVFRPRAGQALNSFVDVDRVEVLRGPQGTLFGKNTTAGAISIITNKPKFEFGGGLQGSVGNYNSRRLEGVVTGPISEKIAFRIAGNYTRRDGVQDKLLGGTAPQRIENYFNNRDRFIIKGQLLFEPTSDLSIRIIGDYGKIKERGNIGQPKTTPAAFDPIFATLGAFRAPDNDLGTRQVQVNTDPSEKTTDGGVTGEITYDFGGAKLTSITAWRDYRSRRAYDLDLVGYDVLRPLPENQLIKQKTQELQLGGQKDRLTWLIGAFLFDEKIDFGSDIRLGPQFAQFAGAAPRFVPLGSFTGQGFNQIGYQTNRGYSFFTQDSFNITDALQITGGIRYNHSNKHGVAIHNGAAVVAPSVPGIFSVNDPFCSVTHIASVCFNRSIDQKLTETGWSGTAKAQYQFSENANAYFSYSHGYKAGGINLDRESIDDRFGVVTDLSRFRPEAVNAYEIGFKSQWLDNRLRFNAALYKMNYSNFQLNSFNGVSFTIINVPASAKGFELELVAAPAKGFTLDASVAHNIARFPNDLSSIPLAGPFSGKDLPSSPHWQASVNLNVDQELPGTGLRGVLNVNTSLISDYNAGSQGDPTQIADGYVLVGGSIGVRTMNDRYGAKFSVTNLANITTPTFITATILQTGGRYAYLNDPRFFQFSVDVKF